MTIKKMITGIFLVIVVGIWVTSIGFAQEAAPAAAAPAEAAPTLKPTCAFSWTFYSQYIWRGLELSKDSLVMFPSITVGLDAGKYGSFGFNMWGDFDTDYKGANIGNNDSEWWETDWVVTYSNSFKVFCDKKLSWTLGWIYYDTDAGDDEEVFGIVGVDLWMNPKFSIWRGVEWGESWYYNLALSHSFGLEKAFPNAKGVTFDVGGWVSYWDTPAGTDYSNWHDANVWAGFTIPVKDWLSLAPSINYTFPMSSSATSYMRNASFDGNDTHFVYGGCALNISF